MATGLWQVFASMTAEVEFCAEVVEHEVLVDFTVWAEATGVTATTRAEPIAITAVQLDRRVSADHRRRRGAAGAGRVKACKSNPCGCGW